MEVLLPILFVIGVFAWRIASVIDAGSLDRREIRRLGTWAWRTAAAACGLTEVTTRQGRSGPLRVSFGGYDRQPGLHSVRLVIDGLAPGLVLRGESFNTSFSRRFLGEQDIEVGDDLFDKNFQIQGSPAIVWALLDVETRRRVWELRRGLLDVPGGWIAPVQALADGRLEVDLKATDCPGLIRVLEKLLEIAHRLAPPNDIEARLAANARSDPLYQVRLNNLLALVREYRESPITQQALLGACEDEHDEVKLQAGMALGEQGRDVLLKIASGEATEEPIAVRALWALGEHLPRVRALAILEQVIGRRRFQTARACLEALGRMGGTEVIEPLARVMADVVERPLRAIAAEALGATGLAAAQAPLIEALLSDSGDLRVAAVKALGHVGAADAIVELNAAGTRYPEDRQLHRAMGPAIAEIQSRLSGASPGQLSLAEGEAGQLSLAEGQAGQLSQAEGEAGRLSLARHEKGGGSPENISPSLPPELRGAGGQPRGED